MDTRTVYRDEQSSRFQKFDERENRNLIPGQNLLDQYEGCACSSKDNSRIVAADSRIGRQDCSIPPVVIESSRTSTCSNLPSEQYRYAEQNYEYANSRNHYREPSYPYVEQRSYYSDNYAPDHRYVFQARTNYDPSYQQQDLAYGTQPIVIIDRMPDQERHHRRGEGVGTALIGLAALAGSVAFSIHGRHGGFNWGMPYGYGYRNYGWNNYGHCNSYNLGSYGWNNYSSGYPYNYGNYGWNNAYQANYGNYGGYGAYQRGGLANFAMNIPYMFGNHGFRGHHGGYGGHWNMRRWGC